ncbi:MAG: response regulator transcription factor [Chitinivibrionales bacterium]|nr:response regulator transcription factor [Chitinivibrionales bacterium]
MSKRIAIIDDDAACRYLYRYHLRCFSDIEIVAEFEKAEDALVHIPRLKPDVFIVDYKLPGMSGIEFAKQMGHYPNIKVLLVTGFDYDFFNSQINDSLTFDIIQKNWSKRSLERIVDFCR